MKAMWRSFLFVGALVLAGCQSSESARDYTPKRPRFFLEAAGSTAATPVVLPQSGVNIGVNPKPVLTEGDVLNVELVQVDLGKCLMFQLTDSAVRDFYRLSGSHQGRRLVLMVDENPLGARRIDGAIMNGVLYVFVEVPEAELAQLAIDLKKSSAALQRELRRKG